LLRELSHALLALGPFGIFAIGLIDSLGIPLPAAMDFLMVTTAVAEPQKAYFAAFMAVMGSTSGNIALFLAARHGSRWLIKGGVPTNKGQKFQRWFERYGLLTVFVPAVTPVVPFPLKVFVISAGALRTRFSKFLLVVLVARMIRYFGEAYLGLHLGKHAEEFLRRNAWPLLGVALGMAMGLYLLIRLLDRRSEAVL
jgi:membrane protein YqaA with SNARE-associated domain